MTVRSSLGGLLRHGCYHPSLSPLLIVAFLSTSLSLFFSLSTSLSISTPTVVHRQTLLRTSLTHSYTLRDFWTLPTLVPIRSHSQLISAFLSHTDLFYDDQRFSLLIAAAIVCDRSRSTNSCHTSIDGAYPPNHHTRDYYPIPTLNTFPHTAHPLLVSA